MKLTPTYAIKKDGVRHAVKGSKGFPRAGDRRKALCGSYVIVGAEGSVSVFSSYSLDKESNCTECKRLYESTINRR